MRYKISRSSNAKRPYQLRKERNEYEKSTESIDDWDDKNFHKDGVKYDQKGLASRIYQLEKDCNEWGFSDDIIDEERKEIFAQSNTKKLDKVVA